MATKRKPGAKKGGARPGAGRPKGLPNKASLQRQKEIAASGATPLDVLIVIMRWNVDRVFEIESALRSTPEDTKAQAKPKGQNSQQAMLAQMKEAMEVAMRAASSAAPYVHQRLSAIERTDSRLDLSKLTDAELAELKRIRAKIADRSGDRGGDIATRH